MWIALRIIKLSFQLSFKLRRDQVFHGFSIVVYMIGCNIHLGSQVKLPQPVKPHDALSTSDNGMRSPSVPSWKRW